MRIRRNGFFEALSDVVRAARNQILWPRTARRQHDLGLWIVERLGAPTRLRLLVDSHRDPILLDDQDGLTWLVLEIDSTLYVYPRLVRSRDQKIVRARDHFGEKIGSFHEPLAGLVLGIDNADVGLRLVVA